MITEAASSERSNPTASATERASAAGPSRDALPRGPRLARDNGTPEAYGAICPSCGGALRIHEGERSVRCGYCGSALLVATPRGTRSYILGARVSESKARLQAIHFIDERTHGRVRGRNTSVVDVTLMHIPFWRMRGRLMGWVSGHRTKLVRVETTSDDPRLRQANATVREERTPYGRLVFKRVDWSTPACVMPNLGLQGISLRTDFLSWELFDDGRVNERRVALPTRGERAARSDALAFLTRLAVPAGSDVRASRFHLFDSSFSLYYYPVYFLRYRHAGRIYSITVDGANGSVLRGEAPERRSRNARNLFFLPAALAFLALAYWPLALVGAGALYAYDCVEARALLAPHRWLGMRLEGAAGGIG